MAVANERNQRKMGAGSGQWKPSAIASQQATYGSRSTPASSKTSRRRAGASNERRAIAEDERQPATDASQQQTQPATDASGRQTVASSKPNEQHKRQPETGGSQQQRRASDEWYWLSPPAGGEQ